MTDRMTAPDPQQEKPQTEWHDAGSDPPPLGEFVLLLASWRDSFLPFRHQHTLYLGWLDQNENEDGEPVEAPWYWAEGGGVIDVDAITDWHSLPALPEEA